MNLNGLVTIYILLCKIMHARLTWTSGVWAKKTSLVTCPFFYSHLCQRSSYKRTYLYHGLSGLSTYQPHLSYHQGAKRPRQNDIGLCQFSTDTTEQKSNFEGLLAMSRCPSSDRTFDQKTNFWRPAGHVTLSRLWLQLCPSKIKIWSPAGHVMLSRLWMKAPPKVKLWRPAGHVTYVQTSDWNIQLQYVKLWRPAGHVMLSRLWLNSVKPKSATLKACWPCHFVESLIEIKTQKSNFEGLLANSRCPGSDWIFDPKSKLWRPAGHVTLSRLWLKFSHQKSDFEGLLAMSRCRGSDWNQTESQTLKACWPCHVVQAEIKILIQSQTLKAFWPCDALSMFWLKPPSKVKLWRACWPCHFVIEALILTELKYPNVKLWRPAGHVTCCRGSDWSDGETSNIEGLLAMSHCSSSDWNNDQKSNFEGLLAMSRCRASDRNPDQKSNFEGLLAMSLCRGSDWN